MSPVCIMVDGIGQFRVWRFSTGCFFQCTISHLISWTRFFFLHVGSHVSHKGLFVVIRSYIALPNAGIKMPTPLLTSKRRLDDEASVRVLHLRMMMRTKMTTTLKKPVRILHLLLLGMVGHANFSSRCSVICRLFCLQNPSC